MQDEQVVGDVAQGTDSSTQTTQAESSNDGTQVQSPQTDNQQPQIGDPNYVSIGEVQKLREEVRLKQEYIEFMKASNQVQQPVKDLPEFNMDPKDVPYVEDVQKLVDARMAQFQQQLEQKQIESDLRSMADTKRSSDPQFDKRMELAIEYMDKDPMALANFDRARTAKDKLDVLEKIARWHPLYGSLGNQQLQPNQDVVDRLKANSQIPATLSSMQTAGNTQVSMVDATEEQWRKKFNEVVKAY